MARKPSFPPVAAQRSPAPHVQRTILARSVQAKLPEGPASQGRSPQPQVPAPSRPHPAAHVRQALAPAQAKLVTPLPSTPRPDQGVLQRSVWEFNATTKVWTGLSKAEGTKYNLPSPRHPQLQDKDKFDDVTGRLTHKAGGPVVEARQLGLSPRQADHTPPPPPPPPKEKPPAKSEQELRNEAAAKAARKEEARRAAAKIPTNAQGALQHYLKTNPHVLQQGMKTLCVLFLKGKGCVTGRSGGPNTKIWERQDDQGVAVKATVAVPDQAKLASFAKCLTEVTRDASLNREVWDCAEVDAAVNALLKGWTEFGKFTFKCAEWPGVKARFIDACPHCRQWSEL